jgi:taurine dioxygenase
MEIVPVTVEIGAEVRGIDLRKPLGSARVSELKDAFARHLVLFFRDQDLTPEEHLAFARQLGEVEPEHMGPRHERHPEIMILDQVNPRGQGADFWHTDNTYMERPPLGSILRAVELPTVGGDTLFASTYAAWEALSAPMREFLAGLRAVHDVTRMFLKVVRDGNAGTSDVAEMQRKHPPVEHPVARTHPVTGRKALYVNSNFISHFVGLSQAESDVLLRMLFEHVRTPDFQCRLRWEPGTLALWDNRCVLHYAVPDYCERRLMHRITLVGERPV